MRHGHKPDKFRDLTQAEIDAIATQPIELKKSEVVTVPAYVPTTEKEIRLARAWDNMAEKLKTKGEREN